VRLADTTSPLSHWIVMLQTDNIMRIYGNFLMQTQAKHAPEQKNLNFKVN
jgi:hypothetical protein